MGDLISRSALIEWINKQREQVTKKQVAGTDGSIFTRETLVTMQRCISTFETKINNMPTAYNVENVVAELEKEIQWAETHGTSADFRKGRISGLKTAIRLTNDIVKRGGVDERT